MKASTSFWIGLTAMLIVALAAVCLFKFVKPRENYGGPVRNIKKIPFNDCQRICNTYYQGCMQDYASLDSEWCRERFGENCVRECYYSSSQRL